VNWVDLTLISVFSLFGLRGYFKGFFREVFSLAGLVIGFLSAVRYGERLAAVAAFYVESPTLIRKGVAFLLIFFMVYFLFSLIGWLLHRLVRFSFLQTFNRLGGVAVGVGKGAAVLAFVVFFLGSASWVPPETRDKVDASYLASPLSRLAENMIRIGKEQMFPESRSEARGWPGRLFA
jgi:membrane protein required for colicin V production